MSFIRQIAAVFSLRRISGQISALVLVSLALIHALIGGYFLLRSPEPRPIGDGPMQQFEILARVLGQAPNAERDAILHQFAVAFPSLQLRLIESGLADEWENRPRLNIPTTLGSPVELMRGRAGTPDQVRYRLPDGTSLTAIVGSPKLPPFIGGLWAGSLLFLFVSVTLLGAWAGRALSSPLSAFARAAESFSLTQSSAPIPEIGPEEIKAAARALNRMHERISTLMNDRTRMLAAISHDLRTPITRLRLRSEFIDDDVQRSQSLRDLDQMQSMLESVLSLLRSGTALAPTLVDIAALSQMVVDEFADCGHNITYEGPARLTWMARPDELRRAATNLAENAVRFGTEVTVRLRSRHDRLMIEVADNGPGISDQCKPAMLEAFVRGDEARNLDASSGFGLGLSIAQAVAHAHNGTLSLHDNDPHGLIVRMILKDPKTP